MITRDLQAICCDSSPWRVDPRDMCDTERCDRGCGSQLAPSASKRAWDRAGGVLGVLGTGLGPQHGEEKDWCCWGFSSEQTRGPPQDVPVLVSGLSPQLLPWLQPALSCQEPPEQLTVPTHLWVTNTGFGTMLGEAPETPLSVTSLAPGSLSSSYLPRGHFTPAPDAISSLSIKKKAVLI